MSFPWAINTNTRTYRKRDKARLASWRPRRKSLRLIVFLALSGTASVLDTPVTRAEPPPTALPQGGTVKSGTASIGPSVDAMGRAIANAMTIEQQTQKAILNWQSFNIGRDASVTFKQPDSTSAALNRISRDSGPSEIFGRLSANGQVYLLNQNGIVFGKSAVVDTHSLIASTLNINDTVFNEIGLTNAINQTQEDKSAFNAQTDGWNMDPDAFVRIESGAVLKSAEGGRIMIFAPQVENAGNISTPGGQAVLAASHDKVYLASSDDENLRGLLVEVETGGDVKNIGKIVTERGNISLLGLVVKQDGIVRATTSVNLNGSIRLVARDTVQLKPVGTGTDQVNIPVASKTGTLTLGVDSLTEVVPDNLVATAPDAQAQPDSRVELMGREVTLESGARVVASAGDVQITATENPRDPGPLNNQQSNSRFTMEAGSRIDVSGLDSAILPMERNVIAVELRGSQLADAPLQRNGPLRGETVYVDVRKGTPLANVQADLERIERPLAERLATGGTVSIQADNKVATDATAVIDVSGGALRYQDGYVNTTQLISQGKVHDIGDADPNRPYDGVAGVYKVEHRKWGVTEVFGSPQGSSRFESGYVEGKDAGTVAINARDLDDMKGTLLGEVTAGRYQRLAPQAIPAHQGFLPRPYEQVPLGGKLALDNAGANDFVLRSLAELGADSMNRVQIQAGRETIKVPEAAHLVFAPGGELTLAAGRVDVEGDITAPGGSVRIQGLDGSTSADGVAARLGTGASIDVSGQWINDGVALNPGAAPQGPAFIDGGEVSIGANGGLVLESGSLIDAGGGAQLQRDGKLKYGKGGDITLVANPPPASTANESSALSLDGELRAYSFDKGGSLNITAAGFRVEDGPGDALASTGKDNTISLKPGFFERGGFNAYNLKSTHTGISVANNTDVRLRAVSRVLDSRFNLQPTGTPLNQLGDLKFLPDYQQQPASLSLAHARDANLAYEAAQKVRVEMGTDSSIRANPGASVTLSSDTDLIVDGTITAPAGDILLNLDGPSLEFGKLPQPQSVWLGPQGQLLAGAIHQPVPDGTGRNLRLGTVRDGGTVTIKAAASDQGYFIANPGSRIDVSGTTQTLDVSLDGRVIPTEVNGAAGSIDLTAVQGMALNGDLIGKAGSGAGAAGGTLSITLNKSTKSDSGGKIAVTAAPVDAPEVGQPVPEALSGLVRVNPDKVRAGGFDELALVTPAEQSDVIPAQIQLEGDVRLDLARRLVLDTPVLVSDGGHAELSAPYLALGAQTAYTDNAPPGATTGVGSLLIEGQHVDLIGTLVLQGFGSDGGADTAPVQIQSDGDIRLIGGGVIQNRADGIYALGRLNSAADVTLRADQIYTATATDFTLSVNRTGPDGQPQGKITIEPGAASEAPLSAASRLTVLATDIEQNGTLRAPIGRIELAANKTLTLGTGSVTSVSGSGQLVPFGKTEFGQDWLYPLGSSQGVYDAAPEKRIVLNADAVTLAPGSVVDVTGGGDLLAREHLPGPGGTRDILNAAQANGAFAIVPTRSNQFGSYDPFLSEGSPAQTGDTIHLAGGGPLPAGEYAMLPAGYALLPGAYLVTPLPKTASPMPGTVVQQHDGAAVVAGQRGVAGSDTRASLWSAFLVENGVQVRNRAEYLESRADSFLASSAARLNRDAGQLVINAGTGLILGGSLASNTTGGRGSEVDILADNLAVVASKTGAGDRVELVLAELNDLNADSLLLGATRRHQGADLVVDVQAQKVTVEKGTPGEDTLSGPEVMLAAKDQVTVTSGAKIEAADGDRVSAPSSIKLTGDSAFARVSSADQVRVDRDASSQGASGKIDIAGADISDTGAVILPAALLNASRSITLDASQDTVVDGNLVTNGGSLSLAASRVSLGQAPEGTSGLVLSNDRLNALDARDLALTSRGSIDFHGNVSLANLNRVALNGAGLGGYGVVGENVSINADTISISNHSNVGFTGTPTGSGKLNLAAREVTVGATGDNGFAVRGFSSTTISATEQIIARPETDTPVNLHMAGDLTLQASRLTASKGADVSIDTQNAAGQIVGAITLAAPATVANLTPVGDLGAKIELAATQIDHGTRIELPSGIVSLHATGAGGVNIADNASIDVSGRDLAFADVTVGSPGGNVSLTADQGNVAIGAAMINASGAPSGGDAGKLSIVAPNGVVEISANAQLAAAHAADARAGSFAVDAQKLANGFSTLNAALNVAGFTDGRHFRFRGTPGVAGSGDVTVAADDTVLARDLRIAADAGKIDVHGKIDASGEQAGQVALYARDDVTLHDASRVDAHANGTEERGGRVTLASTTGRLDLQAGAQINVAGTDETKAPMDTGTVHLRAEREATGGGVKINAIAADINGAERVDIEAYETYTATAGSIDPLISTIKSETSAFMSNAATIENALGVGSDARFHLLPGVEIRSSGDLALNTKWDLFASTNGLSDWRYGGEAGVLTLRAENNLSINQSLSDGVALAKVPVTPQQSTSERDTVQTGSSWSYRLAGGADLAGADPLSVQYQDATGNVTLGSGAKVRTGTGDIEIAAANDLKLTADTSSIYTVGESRGTGVIPAKPPFTSALIKELLYAGEFLEKGGDIRVAVGGDIQGVNSHQLVNEWVARVGGANIGLLGGSKVDLPASWAVSIADFKQNIGALGGGNVTLTAGGSLNNLSVAIPTTGQPAGVPGTAPSIAGGGDLHIDAGGDIRSGVFYLGKGHADMQAGGSVTRAEGEPVYPVLALGDGEYALQARKNLTVETIVNPTVLPMSATQGRGGEMIANLRVAPNRTFFFTYTPDSAVRLESVSGDLKLRNDEQSINSFNLFGDTSSALAESKDTNTLKYLPGTLSARSLQGDIILSDNYTLLPAPSGDLELLAGRNITAGSDSASIRLSDADPVQLPGILNPAAGLKETEDKLAGGLVSGPNIHAATPVHLGDKKPAYIVAQTGGIGSIPSNISPQTGNENQLSFIIAKQARLHAGRDIRSLALRVQHANPDDISVVEAGGNVSFPTERDEISGGVESNPDLFEFSGPGQAYVLAGKDVDLGGSSGIQSIGNQNNPALPDGGASLTVMSGQAQAPAYDAFIERYLVNEDIYRDHLAQYMNDLASHETDESRARAFREQPLDSFRTALPPAQQRKFILEVLFNELRESGIAAAESRNYERGFAAIKTLFPAENYPGDVKSFLSQITTTDGGDIGLVVPGGLVNAGVASTAALGAKSADQLGIVAAREGNINAFVHGDFLVNQSRVFSLDGGDILVWSSAGDIDAGKGAKTALSIPPPKTTTDALGNTIVEFPAAISGSGIRAAVSTPGRDPGEVTLVAPAGVVNAGDAGIGSAGNLTIAATAVLGADNIQVGGASVGVPTDGGGLGAGLAGVGDIAATAGKLSEDVSRGLAEQKQATEGLLSVEVVGFGDGAGEVVNLRKQSSQDKDKKDKDM